MIENRIRSLAGRRVLITGGAGLIGSHLADLLSKAQASQIIVYDNLSRGRLDNLTTARASGRVTLIEGDIRDPTSFARALEGVEILFHLAAIRLPQCAKAPRLALEIMVDGTFNVVEAAAQARVRKIVMASSASIYGTARYFPTDENHSPYDNSSLYGVAKLFGEGLLRAFRETHGIDYVVLRPFNVYGPRMDTQGAYTEVFIRWMKGVAQGRPPVIYGDGTQSMDFVYVDDVARAFLLAASADVAGEVFNIGSGVETSLNELAHMLLVAMGANLPIKYAQTRNLTAVPRRLADTRRARERLGFEARVPLAEGLARLVAWWREEQREWIGSRRGRADGRRPESSPSFGGLGGDHAS